MTKIIRLENGLTCICEPQPGTGKVSLHISIAYGSSHEAAHENGLLNLMQEATQGGTKTRTRENIADDIESGGGQLASYTTRERTIFEVECLSSSTQKIFETVCDVILNPAFDEDEIIQTKEQISEIIDQRDQKPSALAAKKFHEAAFAGQSAGRDPIGTKELIENFDRTQIIAFHKKLLSDPSRIFVSFVGDIDNLSAENLVRKGFSDLVKSDDITPVEFSFTGGDIREEQENEQLNLFFGFKAVSRHDPQKFAFFMLEDLIAGGMSAPLFQEIREKRGLVYSVSASYIPMHADGIFYIRAGTGKGNAGELTDAAFDLLGEMANKPYDHKDLVMSRERIIRGLKGGLETPSLIARRNAQHLSDFGRIIPLEEFEQNLRNVTSDDIRRAALSIISNGKYALSAVGPLDTLPAQNEILSKLKAQAQRIVLPKITITKPALADTNTPVTPQPGISNPVKMTVLPNGMMVVSIERPGTLSCGAWVGAGSAHETAELNGATHMNEHMMFKGTPKYGPGTIDKIVETELRGGLNAYTSKDMTSYYFYNLERRDVEKVVDICGEMVFRANISAKEYEGENGAKGERDVVIEEIKMYNDDIGSRHMYLLDRLSYPNQSQGRPILGTEKTLRAMSADKLRAYRDEYYTCNNVVFSAAGPIAHEEFVRIIEQNFSHMTPKPVKPLPVTSYSGGIAHEEMKGALLCKLSVCAASTSATSPDIFAYEALGEILGGGSSSRFYKEIVNNLGLTSSIGTGILDYTHCGIFGTFANTQPESIKPIIQSIYSEIRKATKNLTEGELEKAKTSMKMSLLSSTETNQDNCDFYGRMTLRFRRLVTPEELIKHIHDITLQDVIHAAQKILLSEPVIAMVVPPGTDPSCIPARDEVLRWRDAA